MRWGDVAGGRASDRGYRAAALHRAISSRGYDVLGAADGGVVLEVQQVWGEDMKRLGR